MKSTVGGGLVTALVVVACSASPKINVGDNPDGAVAGSGGASGSSGFGGFGGGGDNALTAAITEPPSEMAIEVITISCAGECKQVLAVATGGNAPYTFAWSDGVTTAARDICAEDETTFAVTVRDTAIVDGEFPYAQQTTTASVRARVLECPVDGGAVAADGGVDASVEVGMCGSEERPLDYQAITARCDLASAGTDCPGYQVFDLPHRVEAGGFLCLIISATAPLLALQYDAFAGTACTLNNTIGGGGTLGGSAITHDVCVSHDEPVDRVGFTGTREAGSVVTVHQCPCEEL